MFRDALPPIITKTRVFWLSQVINYLMCMTAWSPEKIIRLAFKGCSSSENVFAARPIDHGSEIVKISVRVDDDVFGKKITRKMEIDENVKIRCFPSNVERSFCL